MDVAIRMRHIPNRGFTIAEMLVAIVVGLLVLAGVHQMFVSGLKAEVTTSSQVDVDRRAQVAMDDIVSRLRHSSRSTLTNSPAILDDFDSAHADRIHFAGPPEVNLEPAAFSDVRYWLDAGSLMRNVGGSGYTGGSVLATGVQTLAFTFYDANGAVTNLAGNTSRVRIQLEIRDGRNSSLIESTVRLRNM